MTAKNFLTVLAAACALPLLAVDGEIGNASTSYKGDIKWQPRSKSYAVSYKKGKTTVSAEINLDDVTRLDIPKPAALDKAIDMVENKRGASAIETLRKIVETYKMLVWDKPAARYLVFAYLDAGKLKDANDVAAGVIAQDPTAAYRGDMAAAYWQVLLKQGKRDKLEGVLKKAIGTGDRAAAAAATVMRGDMIMAEGDSNDIYKRALRDGYLRASLMYADPDCVRERQEAMNKAAACFDKLGQASRAEKLRTQARSL